MQFEKFPSIKRLKRNCVITEKLDGTNSQITFDEVGNMLCGSRNREITPEDDNYGFARWAYDKQDQLFHILGEGRHFGEWWGQGIQRRYAKNEKTLSLFNTGRWCKEDLIDLEQLEVVPLLYSGIFSSDIVDETMDKLKKSGSIASLGYMKPEGVVIYHTQIQQMFKVTFEHDIAGKPK